MYIYISATEYDSIMKADPTKQFDVRNLNLISTPLLFYVAYSIEK